jgi:hypothetical protein
MLRQKFSVIRVTEFVSGESVKNTRRESLSLLFGNRAIVPSIFFSVMDTKVKIKKSPTGEVF